MYSNLFLPFSVFILLGISMNYYLFKQDQGKKKTKGFFTSERFFVFTIEILIAVIGFGITLSITNANERQMEKETASQMISQVIEFTDRQIERERSYLNMYKKETLTAEGLRVSNRINLDYYNNILSTDVVLQNANMNTYGDIMTYLLWIEQRDDLARDAEGDRIYNYMVQRYNHLKKLREFLVICHDELTGNISAEEAKQRCRDIKYPSEETTETTGIPETTMPATAGS